MLPSLEFDFPASVPGYYAPFVSIIIRKTIAKQRLLERCLLTALGNGKQLENRKKIRFCLLIIMGGLWWEFQGIFYIYPYNLFLNKQEPICEINFQRICTLLIKTEDYNLFATLYDFELYWWQYLILVFSPIFKSTFL